jgi:hypothetical protein
LCVDFFFGAYAGRWGLVLTVVVFNEFLFSSFHPIIAGLDGIDQRFLFSVHGACIRHLNFQIATVEAEKSLGLKQIVKAASCDHLEDKTVLMPIIARVLIHVDRTALGTFSFLHRNLLLTT